MSLLNNIKSGSLLIFPSATALGVSISSAKGLIKLPVAGAGTNAFDEILKATPPALVAFLANLPAVEGNFRNFY